MIVYRDGPGLLTHARVNSLKVTALSCQNVVICLCIYTKVKGLTIYCEYLIVVMINEIVQTSSIWFRSVPQDPMPIPPQSCGAHTTSCTAAASPHRY